MRILVNPKIDASNRSGHIRITDAPVSHSRCFWFFFFVKIVLVLLTAQNAKNFCRDSIKVNVIFVKSRVHLFFEKSSRSSAARRKLQFVLQNA